MTKPIVLRTCSVFVILSTFFAIIAMNSDTSIAWILSSMTGSVSIALAIFAAATTEKRSTRMTTAATVYFRPTGS